MIKFMYDAITNLILNFVLNIFNRRFIGKPKARLYIESDEPNVDQKNQFILKFYLNNLGKKAAKNVQISVEFNNDVEIIEATDIFKRIDKHRGGMPAVQCNIKGPIYSYPSKKIINTYIGEILLKLKEQKKEISIKHDIIAENMAHFVDVKKIKPDFKINQ